MKDFEQKVIMFAVGVAAGTFLMKKAVNKSHSKPPEHITFDHVQSLHNTQKLNAQNQTFSQFRDEKFQSENMNMNRSSPLQHTNLSSTFTSTNTYSNYPTNRNSPYSSLMSGTPPTDKKINA